MSQWTRWPDVKTKLNKSWQQGKLMRLPLDGQDDWPRHYSLRQPTAGELVSRFTEVRSWIKHWQEQENNPLLEIQWREVNSRDLGRNELPAAVVIEAPEDAQKLIGQRPAGRVYEQLGAELATHSPELLDWLIRRPLQAVELKDHWPRLLSIIDWLRAHPRPGIYLRQLDLPGIDTKFIEAHKKVLTELLDLTLAPEQINAEGRGVKGFEERYSFRKKPVTLRFRLLDPALYIHGLSDLQLPVEDFARLQLPVKQVFITENEINGLAFPDYPHSLVIFGLGYGLDCLKNLTWLAEQPIHYWGDIDTHGFAMLDQLRSYFPHTCSLLMDRATLLAHQAQWGEETQPTHKHLPRLNPQEAALYDDLCQHRLAPRLRLEQERIGMGSLLRAINCCVTA